MKSPLLVVLNALLLAFSSNVVVLSCSIDPRLEGYSRDDWVSLHLQGKSDDASHERRLNSIQHLPREERDPLMMEMYQERTQQGLGDLLQALQDIFGKDSVRSYWISHSLFVDCQAKDIEIVQKLIQDMPVIERINDDTSFKSFLPGRQRRLEAADALETLRKEEGPYDFDSLLLDQVLDSSPQSHTNETHRVRRGLTNNVRDEQVLDQLMGDIIPNCTKKGFDLQSLNDEDIDAMFKIHGIDKVWKEYGVTGKGIEIGLISTGANFDVMLCTYRGYDVGAKKNPIKNDYNWFEPYEESQIEPNDPFKIATIILSVMGSYGRDDFRNVGIANNAKWIACRGISFNGRGSIEGYNTCIQFMAAPFDLNRENPRPELRPQIVNLPFTCQNCKPDSLDRSLKTLLRFGTFIVGETRLLRDAEPVCENMFTPPQIYPEVFTIGGLNSVTGGYFNFSARGPVRETSFDGYQGIPGMNKPEMVATATNVASMYHDSGLDPDIVRPVLTSTTFSVSVVAGAAALILEACPDYIDNPIALGRLLLETAKSPMGEDEDCGSGWQNPLYYADGRYFDNSQGYGSLDVKAAIDRCIPKKKKGGKKSSGGKKSDDDLFV